jgi:hypothetical protein
MRQMRPSLLTLALVFPLFTFVQAGNAARAGNYSMEGFVFFTNVRQATQQGALVPYIGYGNSPQIGPHYQSGVILVTSGLTPVDATTFTFTGEVGPNPYMPNHPKIHLITTNYGNLFCTWTAKFTLKIINTNGDAVLSGDGAFTVVGGTGRYKKAYGSFETLFQTSTIPQGANDASANVTENGTIRVR